MKKRRTRMFPILDKTFWRGSQVKSLNKVHCLARCSSPSPCAPPSPRPAASSPACWVTREENFCKTLVFSMQGHGRSAKNYVSVHCGSSSMTFLLCVTQTWTWGLPSVSGHSKVSHWRRRIRCVQTHFKVSSHWSIQVNILSPMHFHAPALLMSHINAWM